MHHHLKTGKELVLQGLFLSFFHFTLVAIFVSFFFFLIRERLVEQFQDLFTSETYDSTSNYLIDS